MISRFVFVEEVPSTRTLERQSRKAGPIFGLDEDLGFGINSNLDVYDAKSENSALYEYAEKQLYKQFLSMEQDLSIDTEFDIESWARYFALTDIFGSYHGSLPKSVKFYLIQFRLNSSHYYLMRIWVVKI